MTTQSRSDQAPERAFLPLDQAAHYLGISANTLYIWRHRRQGPPSFCMGRRVMYRISALDAWIEQQEQADSRSNHALSPLSRAPQRRTTRTCRTPNTSAQQRRAH